MRIKAWIVVGLCLVACTVENGEASSNVDSGTVSEGGGTVSATAALGSSTTSSSSGQTATGTSSGGDAPTATTGSDASTATASDDASTATAGSDTSTTTVSATVDSGTAAESSGDTEAYETSGDTDAADEAMLCDMTGGVWDPTTCGHYQCGRPQPCRAIIPGCDCGEGQSFYAGVGCRPSSCSEDDLLCQQTGGVWKTYFCGHWSCTEEISCAALVPGCDCGLSMRWVENEGCQLEASCGILSQGDACSLTRDRCGPGLACCRPCGTEGCEHECTPVEAEGQCPAYR